MSSIQEQQELRAARVVAAAIGLVMLLVAAGLFAGWLLYRPALQGFK